MASFDSANGPSVTNRPFFPETIVPVQFKRAARFRFTLRGQSFEPGLVLGDEFLELFVRKPVVPFIGAVEQHVSILILCVHISLVGC